MLVALYARFSSENQREESITAQLRACKSYCQRKGYKIIKEYVDEAYTGKNDRRPAYQAMLKDAEGGFFQKVIAHKLDRIGRNEYDYYKNKHILNLLGIDIEFAGQAFDTSTPEGALMENQLAGISAYYSRNLSKEVMKGLKENVRQGKSTGGPPLFGYRYTPDKKYIIDEHEAIAVRYVFNAYLQGESYINICTWLNDHGYKTRRNRPFGKNSIHDMLKRRRYIGDAILGGTLKMRNGKRNSHKINPNAIIVEGVCPAIISKEQFHMVEEKMKRNSKRPSSYKANYLLSGLVFCGHCHAPMNGNLASRSKKRYYRCSKKSRFGKLLSGCNTVDAPADELEKLVVSKLEHLIYHPDTIDNLTDKILSDYQKIIHDEEELKKHLKQKENQLLKKIDAFYDFLVIKMPDEFEIQRIEGIKNEVRAIRKKLSEMQQTSHPELDRETIINYLASYRDAMEKCESDSPRVKSLINQFVEKITITPENIVIRYKFVFDGVPDGNRTRALGFGDQCSIH